MKLSLDIGGRSIAIGTALMIVLSSGTLIRANGDDLPDANQTANLTQLVALKGQIPGSGVSLQVRPSVVLAAAQ